MHGMLSSAVVLAAFAVIAGAGGYVAVWLFRASSGDPARSRPAPGPDASGQVGRIGRPGDGAAGYGEAGHGEAGDRTVEADGTGWPGEADGTGWPGEAVVPDGSRVADEADEANESDESGEADESAGTGWPDESPGARIYVLGRPRTPSR